MKLDPPLESKISLPLVGQPWDGLGKGIAICGQGAVTPGGVGVDSLLNDRECRAEILPKLKGDGGWPVYTVNLNDQQWTHWQNEPRLRRAPRIALFMIEAARQALEIGHQHDSISTHGSNSLGIVAAFFTGPIAYSRRFFQESIEQGKRFASPALFPETVFNSPTSHIASMLGATGPCYSVVGDDSAWVGAISVAACWLKLGVVKRVLVMGAEELEPVVVEAYARARWIRKEGRFIPSEGAGALLLRNATEKDDVVITEIAEGFTYRSPGQAGQAALECLSSFGDVQNACRSARNNWFARIEEDLFIQKNIKSPPTMPYRGEAFAASAAWNTIRAASQVGRGRDRLLLPVWGLNEQCSALLLDSKNAE